MTAIARFYNKFLSCIELDPTRNTHICKFSDPARVRPTLSDPARPDPTRGSTRPACNSSLFCFNPICRVETIEDTDKYWYRI